MRGRGGGVRGSTGRSARARPTWRRPHGSDRFHMPGRGAVAERRAVPAAATDQGASRVAPNRTTLIFVARFVTRRESHEEPARAHHGTRRGHADLPGNPASPRPKGPRWVRPSPAWPVQAGSCGSVTRVAALSCPPASFDQSPPENSELALVPLRESFYDCQRRLKMSHMWRSVQIQLGKQSAQLLRPPREQRQHPTLEPLLDAPNPRASECDRARAHRQPPRLAISVALALGRVHRTPALRLLPALYDDE